VESKVSKLPRFYDNVQSVEMTLDVEADQPVAEVVVTARRKNVFVATYRGPDMYACIDQCLHKVQEQLRRHKDRVRDRQGPSHSETMEPPEH
jgi:putative sigma-54 modulation protein